MGDAICIFQEDNERRINSAAIPPGIMMLIFQIKGRRAPGSYERNSLCSPSTSHSQCILIGSESRVHVGAGNIGKKR